MNVLCAFLLLNFILVWQVKSCCNGVLSVSYKISVLSP